MLLCNTSPPVFRLLVLVIREFSVSIERERERGTRDSYGGISFHSFSLRICIIPKSRWDFHSSSSGFGWIWKRLTDTFSNQTRWKGKESRRSMEGWVWDVASISLWGEWLNQREKFQVGSSLLLHMSETSILFHISGKKGKGLSHDTLWSSRSFTSQKDGQNS